jgi:hypothetical protein
MLFWWKKRPCPFFLSQKRGKPLKNALLRSMGRCPIPHAPFEKGAAKTFLSASPGVERSIANPPPKSVSFSDIKVFAELFLKSDRGVGWNPTNGGLEAEPPKSICKLKNNSCRFGKKQGGKELNELQDI